MSLHQLPLELIEAIARELPWPSLSALSRASHRFNTLTASLLRHDTLLLSSNGRTLRRQHRDVGTALEDATSVTVVSPEPNNTTQGSIRGRCLGCDVTDSLSERGLGSYLICEALGKCRPGRLRKFSWLLGVCVEPDILGLTGILATQQPHLEEIRLITCYDRLGLRCQSRTLDLTPFSHLQSLSWTGVHRSQFAVLERALGHSAPRLVSLELDFLSSMANHQSVPGPDLQPSYFPRVVLGLPRTEGSAAFPRLTSLSLTNVDLATSPSRDKDLCLALNAPKLRSLKLKQCPGWRGFVSAMRPVPRRSELPLRSLEVHTAPPDGDIYDSVLLRLFQDCPALEELASYVINSAPATDEAMSLPFTGFNLPRLRRVVLHEADTLASGRPEQPTESPDLPDMYDLSINPLSDSNLEFLGLAAPPVHIRFLLEYLTQREAMADLQVLHVRQDHEEIPGYYSRALGYAVPDEETTTAIGPIDLKRMLTPESHDLATWAFTSERFPSLQILAFGDFGSFDPLVRVLLCRSSGATPFRLVTESDGDAVLLLDRYAESLVVGPSYSRPHLRKSGASLGGNVWRAGLGTMLARESGERGATVPETIMAITEGTERGGPKAGGAAEN